jgi:uncharacterized protein with HEPN domain
MSKRNTIDYLQDMLQEMRDIAEFTQNGKTDFLQDTKTRKAVIRSYEIMGEIAKRLPESFRQMQTQVDWRRLIGFRDFLAHHYEEVILENVWEAVADLPNLRQAIEALISTLENSPSIE